MYIVKVKTFWLYPHVHLVLTYISTWRALADFVSARMVTMTESGLMLLGRQV